MSLLRRLSFALQTPILILFVHVILCASMCMLYIMDLVVSLTGAKFLSLSYHFHTNKHILFLDSLHMLANTRNLNKLPSLNDSLLFISGYAFNFNTFFMHDELNSFYKLQHCIFSSLRNEMKSFSLTYIMLSFHLLSSDSYKHC